MSELCCISVVVLFIAATMINAHPKRMIALYGIAGGVFLSLFFVLAFFNIRDSSAGVGTEKMDASVRENPSSYRPVMILHTGYLPRYSSGGWSGGK